MFGFPLMKQRKDKKVSAKSNGQRRPPRTKKLLKVFQPRLFYFGKRRSNSLCDPIQNQSQSSS
jgi:hypothetical protein